MVDQRDQVFCHSFYLDPAAAGPGPQVFYHQVLVVEEQPAAAIHQLESIGQVDHRGRVQVEPTVDRCAGCVVLGEGAFITQVHVCASMKELQCLTAIEIVQYRKGKL